jgi:hypothetical protein
MLYSLKLLLGRPNNHDDWIWVSSHAINSCGLPDGILRRILTTFFQLSPCRDLTQPYNMRWFQIFYLILSTGFVGSTLGGLASLRGDIEEVRRKTAWERRKVSRALIDEMQPEENDAKIDQYEFLVASLLQLGKIASEDVEVSRSWWVSARSRKRKTYIFHIFLGIKRSRLWIR